MSYIVWLKFFRFDPEALEELETWIGNRDMTKEDQKV